MQAIAKQLIQPTSLRTRFLVVFGSLGGVARRAARQSIVRRELMKTSGKTARRDRRDHRTQQGAAAGCAIFLMSGAGVALAQDQSSDEIGEVVVTGIRKSIQDSIGVKKNESSIVEVVSAEDIGKLPDSSIAE